MTRVVKIEKTGGPEVLKFETIQLGKLAPQEVLIEHKAIGLNFIDTYHRSGLYPLKLPSGIGGEGSGIIKEIGSKVKDFSVGDSIAYAGAPLWSYSAERNYPTKNLIKKPNGINFDVELEKDKGFNFDLPFTHNSFVYLIEGEIKIGDKNHDKVNGSILIILAKGEKLKVKAVTKSKFLLISGKPIGEPIASGGPFVMNTKEEILKAVEDYQSGNFVQKWHLL